METVTDVVCQYCKKSFRRPESLVVHVCEQKRRRQERSERGVELGFQSYLRFYQLAQGSKNKTYDDFCESPYYKAFTKFGRYCVGAKVINPRQFTEWLLKNNKKLDKWGSDQLYTEYLIEYLTLENVSDALTRAIEYSIDWSDRNSASANDCLRYGSANATCYAITTGRISPWVVYNCDSGQEFLNSLNSEQLSMIWPYINSDVWQKKLTEYKEDREYAKDILKQAGW